MRCNGGGRSAQVSYVVGRSHRIKANSLALNHSSRALRSSPGGAVDATKPAVIKPRAAVYHIVGGGRAVAEYMHALHALHDNGASRLASALAWLPQRMFG